MGQAWGGFLLKPEEEEKEEEKPEEVPAGKQMLQIPTLPYDGFRLGNQGNMGFNFCCLLLFDDGNFWGLGLWKTNQVNEVKVFF